MYINPIYHRSSLNFYLKQCKKAKGKVLEIASGTGRILIPAMKATADIIEETPEQLERRMISVLRGAVQAEWLDGTYVLIIRVTTSNPSRSADLANDMARHYILDQLEKVLSQEKIELGLVAVPAARAQEVADKLVEAGVSGILNFAPVTLSVPPGVSKVGVDLARELEQVTFAVANRGDPRNN